MAYDLTLSGATFNASGKFGQSMNGGTASTNDVFLGQTSATLEAWAKTTSTGALKVLCGAGGNPWLGMQVNGTARGTWSSGGTDRDILSSVVINDGAWHHLALCVNTTTGSTLWVDGVLAGSNAATGAMTAGVFGVRRFGTNTSYDWPGEVDEIAVSSVVKYTTTFTPAAISNAQANLIAVWHLDGDGVNNAGVTVGAATAVTMTGPTSGLNGVASTNFSVGVTPVGGTITGTVTITPNDASNGGTFAPTSLGLTTATPTGTFTYTPASTGAKTISVTNSGTLSSPSSITYTATSSATVPATMAAPVATAGDTTASIAYTVPSDGGAAITGYTVTPYIGATAQTAQTFGVGAGPVVATGLTNGTAYTFKIKASNSVGPGVDSPASNSVTPAAVASAIDTTKMTFSPYNWYLTSTTAKTVNDGAYFRTIFGGASCTLTFDMTGLSAPYAKLRYRIDGFGPWTEVTLAASIALTMPTETTGYASHVLEFAVRSTSEVVSRWSPQSTAIVLTGITLAATKVLTKPPALPLNLLVLGDSITAGVNAITNTGDATVRGDAQQSYTVTMARLLGAEVGVVGFGGQGWVTTGGGSVPVVGTTWDKLFSGQARVLSPVPDAIIINQGTNDGANSTTTAVTSMLNAVITATTRVTKIIVLRPFNGNQATNIQAGIAACSDPTRIIYLDTTGFYNSANSSDTTHPYGWEHITHIGPAMADAVRPYIHPLKGTRTARTITLTLRDSGGAVRANLTGLKWAVSASARPDLKAVVEDSGTGLTTNASGVATVTVYTTAASGGVVGLEISDTDGTVATAHKAFVGPVTVA